MLEYVRLTEESDIAREEREELRIAELGLMRRREEVAEMRRQMSSPTTLDSYQFLEASISGAKPHASVVSLDDLVTSERSTLVYHLMLGKAQTAPCPMCTMWVDGLNGVARHLESRVNLIVVGAADPDTLREFATVRGWDQVRLLSAGTSTFKYDLGTEDSEGNQSPAISVLSMDSESGVSHCYSVTPAMADDQFERGIDLLSPVWNMLDLIPEGRGSWYPSVEY